MEGYRKSSHAIYRCEYHFVWIPKYRYQILVRDVKPQLKGILTELCEWLDITIIEGAICSDHVHMYISMSPKYSPAQVMKLLKGKSAEYLRKEFPELSKRYWGMHIWARGYFVSTVGIDRDVIKAYVKKQIETQIREEQFRIWRDGSE
ncbi:MAG: IS200/IS605 family transposase [Proteobacteria bacterium]|nr:IS200/IS605 family transposase [Pseudomonadota bacterium]